MVASIRHWAIACDVIREVGGSAFETGEIGDILFAPRGGLDPFLERPASAWLVHWLLAGRATRSATWFWVFNRVTQQTFSRASLLEGLRSFVEERGLRVAQITLKRDIEVCVRCYLTRHDAKDVDDAAEPLLADLGLLVGGAGESLQFRRGEQLSLPNGIFAFALLDFWDRWSEQTQSNQATLSFEAISYEYGSPGRVFKMDENAIAERVLALADLTNGALRWSDSAGVRQVVRKHACESRELKSLLLRDAYGR